MRILLAVLALGLMPAHAFAQCACTCVRGRSVPACPSTALSQPICQQVCPERVDQALGSTSLGTGAIPPASLSGSAGGGAAAAALGALIGR